MVTIAEERRRLREEGLEIAYRETWGALVDYDLDRPTLSPAIYHFWHIAVIGDPLDILKAEYAAMRQVEKIGVARFGPDVGFPYNGGVFDTGLLAEGQPDARRGAHTVNDKKVPGFPMPPLSMNREGRALTLMQNVGDAVTEEMVDSSAQWAAARMRAKLSIPSCPWDAHRQFAFKSCPGDLAVVEFNNLKKLTVKYEKVGLPGTLPPPKPPDPPQPEPEEGPVTTILSYRSTRVQGIHTYLVTDGRGKHLDQASLGLCRKLNIPEGSIFGGTTTAPLGDDWIGTVILVDGPLQNVNGGPLDL